MPRARLNPVVKVFVTGGTGVLGRRLIPRLVKAGHEVIALTRKEEGDITVRRLGATPARANLFDRVPMRKAMSGCDAIVHAASFIPTVPKPKPEYWHMNDRIRVEGTQVLLDIAREIGARRIVFPSVAWVARQPGGAPFDETSPVHADALTLSAVEAETLLRTAAAAGGPQASILRLGWLYAPDAAHTRMMGDGLKRGRMPIIGKGAAALSILHADDAAAALACAVDAPAGGLWNVVDDAPVPVGEFLRTFAQAIGAPEPKRVPAWLARFVAGKDAVDFLTWPMQTNHAAFTAATGWRPDFATHREGLAQIAKAWRAEGFPHEKR